MSKLTIKETGVKEVDDILKGLPLLVTDKILQQAHASAVKPTVTKAKLTAPEGPTGNLVDSIGVVKDRSKGLKELGIIYAGPRRGRYKGYAAHLVEFGTKQRSTQKGANRGVMPAKPFMEPAWETTRSAVLDDINNQTVRKVTAFMKRKAKA